MSNNDKLSFWELMRGILNFVLSVAFMLTVASGELNLMILCMLGLILANFDLMRGGWSPRINSPPIQSK